MNKHIMLIKQFSDIKMSFWQENFAFIKVYESDFIVKLDKKKQIQEDTKYDMSSQVWEEWTWNKLQIRSNKLNKLTFTTT